MFKNKNQSPTQISFASAVAAYRNHYKDFVPSDKTPSLHIPQDSGGRSLTNQREVDIGGDRYLLKFPSSSFSLSGLQRQFTAYKKVGYNLEKLGNIPTSDNPETLYVDGALSLMLILDLQKKIKSAPSNRPAPNTLSEYDRRPL